MRSYRVVLSLVGVHTLLCADARADPAGGDPDVADAAARHAFVLMDNTGNGSEIDVEVASGWTTDALSLDDGLFVTKIVVQYVAPRGLGGYARLSAEATDVHNVELGLLYQHRADIHGEMGIRGSVTLPTGGEGNPFFGLGILVMRPADLVVAIDRPSIRLGLSPTHRRDGLVLRADLGLDVVIPGDEDSDLHFLGRINLGAAIQRGALTASAEMQFVALLGDDEGHSQVFGISARFRARQISPFLSISTPLGNDLTGEIVIVSTGLTVSL